VTYELTTIRGVPMYLIKEDPGISSVLKRRGVHEPWLVQTLEQTLKKDMVGLDIGANLGFFAILEAGLCRKVYAIEPVPENYKALVKTVYYNRINNIDASPIALGNKNGTNKMLVTKQSNWGTLVKEENGSDFYRSFFGEHKTGEIEVKEMTLDAWMQLIVPKSIDFIRMDVEGYEHEIIEGGTKTLAKMEEGSLLFIEWHNLELNDYPSKMRKSLGTLVECGFSPFAAYGKMGKEIGKPINVNADFIEKFSTWNTASFHLYFRK